MLTLWYQTPLGSSLRAAELNGLAARLQTVFGYHILLTGSSDETVLEHARVRYRTILTDMKDSSIAWRSQQNREYLTLVHADVNELPIQSDSVDSVILYHTLEFNENPHQVLREAERVLVPEGNLIILGFNPYSQWGVTRWFRVNRKNTPWKGRFISISRIRDWLNLLGFECKQVDQVFFRPPINHSGILQKLNFIETLGSRFLSVGGAVFILMATKKVTPLILIKPRWRPQKRVPGLVEN